MFVPDFNVKTGQWIYPAADLSEQISTAGKEASGTGNMKFAMNGALTIGTLDGANVEIREAVGAENFFLFGLTRRRGRADLGERATGRATSTSATSQLRTAIDLINSGLFSHGDRELFRPLADDLLNHDPYLVLADFAVLRRVPGRGRPPLPDTAQLDADVHPQRRADRAVLVGSGDSRVLQGHLEGADARRGHGHAVLTAAFGAAIRPGAGLLPGASIRASCRSAAPARMRPWRERFGPGRASYRWGRDSSTTTLRP